jgi:hypothetical protein
MSSQEGQPDIIKVCAVGVLWSTTFRIYVIFSPKDLISLETTRTKYKTLRVCPWSASAKVRVFIYF